MENFGKLISNYNLHW